MIRTSLISLAAIILAACSSMSTSQPSLTEAPPIVFVHGNGDNAALWQTTMWRFETSGWPRERLYAIDVPYPQASDDATKQQVGRTTAQEHMLYLKSEVEKVLKNTGATQVVLFGNSRGGNAIRNYIQNGGGDKTVSHAILGGTPNHGVWAIKGFREANEFSGTGPFLTSLNAPKNTAGDEVAPPVKWMTIRSDNNDKYAQPDGLWIGAKGTPTNVTFAGPELKGATSVIIPRIDHRETSFSPAAFAAAYIFITGKAPQTATIAPENPIVLNGQLTGITAEVVDNIPVVGAALTIYETDSTTGKRLGEAVHTRKIAADGIWGPFNAKANATYEFVLQANGYATLHIYRSPFPRSSNVVHLRAERIVAADKNAGSITQFTRPRGYFDLSRDKMSFDGGVPPALPPAGAGLAASKLKLPVTPQRSIVAEFNGERIVGQTWPAADADGGHLVNLEITQ